MGIVFGACLVCFGRLLLDFGAKFIACKVCMFFVATHRIVVPLFALLGGFSSVN